MNRRRISTLCLALAAILPVCFAVKVITDRVVYSNTLNSAPFYLWVVVDAVYFLLPAVIALAVGLVLRGKK